MVDDQVPVAVQLPGDGPELVEPDARDEGPLQRGPHRLVVEQLVEERLPPLVERHGRPDLVEHLERRWQAGFERVLGEDPLGEPVQCREHGRVDLRNRLGRESAPLAGFLVGDAFELLADTVAQLAGRGLGEGDGGDVV